MSSSAVGDAPRSEAIVLVKPPAQIRDEAARANKAVRLAGLRRWVQVLMLSNQPWVECEIKKYSDDVIMELAKHIDGWDCPEASRRFTPEGAVLDEYGELDLQVYKEFRPIFASVTGIEQDGMFKNEDRMVGMQHTDSPMATFWSSHHYGKTKKFEITCYGKRLAFVLAKLQRQVWERNQHEPVVKERPKPQTKQAMLATLPQVPGLTVNSNRYEALQNFHGMQMRWSSTNLKEAVKAAHIATYMKEELDKLVQKDDIPKLSKQQLKVSFAKVVEKTEASINDGWPLPLVYGVKLQSSKMKFSVKGILDPFTCVEVFCDAKKFSTTATQKELTTYMHEVAQYIKTSVVEPYNKKRVRHLVKFVNEVLRVRDCVEPPSKMARTRE